MTIIQARERPGRPARSRGTLTYGQGAAGGGGEPGPDLTPSLLLETDTNGQNFIWLENNGQIYLE